MIHSSDIDDEEVGQLDELKDSLDLDITSVQMKDVYNWVNTKIDHTEEERINLALLSEEHKWFFFNVVKEGLGRESPM